MSCPRGIKESALDFGSSESSLFHFATHVLRTESLDLWNKASGVYLAAIYLKLPTEAFPSVILSKSIAWGKGDLRTKS